jgi:hypothetical protein
MWTPVISAAIAVIPVTAAVVVLVITVAILGKLFRTTFTVAILIGSCGGSRGNKVLLFRIKACTLLAITVLPFFTTLATTVTPVPAATTVVVVVVAVTIFDVRFFSARF